MMMTDTIERLKRRFAEFPMMRADSVSTVPEVAAAAQAIGIPFSPDYRTFLLTFGGGVVGPYPIFGLRSAPVMGKRRSLVVEITKQYRSHHLPGCESWVVVSEDHAGNPIGMDCTGAIWIHDHDFGGVSRLARSLEEYIRVRCLGLPNSS